MMACLLVKGFAGGRNSAAFEIDKAISTDECRKDSTLISPEQSCPGRALTAQDWEQNSANSISFY